MVSTRATGRWPNCVPLIHDDGIRCHDYQGSVDGARPDSEPCREYTTDQRETWGPRRAVLDPVALRGGMLKSSQRCQSNLMAENRGMNGRRHALDLSMEHGKPSERSSVSTCHASNASTKARHAQLDDGRVSVDDNMAHVPYYWQIGARDWRATRRVASVRQRSDLQMGRRHEELTEMRMSDVRRAQGPYVDHVKRGNGQCWFPTMDQRTPSFVLHQTRANWLRRRNETIDRRPSRGFIRVGFAGRRSSDRSIDSSRVNG